MKISLHGHIINPGEDMVCPSEETRKQFNFSDIDCDIILVQDQYLTKTFDVKKPIIAWLKENPDIYEYSNIFSSMPYNPYHYLNNNLDKFDYVLSAFEELQPILKEKFIYCPVGGSRISRDQWGIYNKEKLLSIVASNKQWTVGHRLRHMVIQQLKDKIDVYGNGYNNIIDSHGVLGKVYALAPYYFHLSIMNSPHNGYFTEVLTDCFATGTIPIFYGCRNISKYFNPDGIITFESIPQLIYIVDSLTPELYNSKLKAVAENFEISKKYITDYDYIYENKILNNII